MKATVHQSLSTEIAHQVVAKRVQDRTVYDGARFEHAAGLIESSRFVLPQAANLTVLHAIWTVGVGMAHRTTNDAVGGGLDLALELRVALNLRNRAERDEPEDARNHSPGVGATCTHPWPPLKNS